MAKFYKIRALHRFDTGNMWMPFSAPNQVMTLEQANGDIEAYKRTTPKPYNILEFRIFEAK